MRHCSLVREVTRRVDETGRRTVARISLRRLRTELM